MNEGVRLHDGGLCWELHDTSTGTTRHQQVWLQKQAGVYYDRHVHSFYGSELGKRACVMRLSVDRRAWLRKRADLAAGMSLLYGCPGTSRVTA